ncbi:MAG: glucan biosynthesis protein G, partial [Pseudomonadota bacterium]
SVILAPLILALVMSLLTSSAAAGVATRDNRDVQIIAPVASPARLVPVEQIVITQARALAAAPFEAPQSIDKRKLPANYDDYRKVRFKTEKAIWRGLDLGFELHVMPAGWLFSQPIDLHIVGDDGQIEVFQPSADYFDDQRAPNNASSKTGVRRLAPAISGFKINGPLNAPDKSDEIIVFQGASYFRALGKGHAYGLSARGLAVSTASPRGEEFPVFRAFWVEKPKPGAREVIVHALLDSRSVAGAYTFKVRPGQATVVDVRARLFPRRALAEIGIAPLTSMFLLGTTEPTRASDFRPKVHDSDGLAIWNANDERIWRPVVNHRTLQISSFLDDKPKGFGLIQRARNFRDYQDLEARFEDRPSAWIETISGFGKGQVILVEIPTNEEIHDNVVAFWRPLEPIKKGDVVDLTYRIHWRDDAPMRSTGPYVLSTRVGRAGATNSSRRNEYLFVVDFVADQPFSGSDLPSVRLSTSLGTHQPPVIQKNTETGGLRVSFYFDPQGASTSDMRLEVGAWNGSQPETWLYRWSPHQ